MIRSFHTWMSELLLTNARFDSRLAYCELHVAVAAVVLRALPYTRLYETTDVDVEYDFDLAVSMPKKGSKGVRLEMI